MSEYVCQVCGITRINPKAYEKLDELAGINDSIVCLNCFAAYDNGTVMKVKAESRTAKLVQIVSL